MLIVCEGVDGCGKTYHSERLARRLDATLSGYPRYHTPIGQGIRDWLAGNWEAHWSTPAPSESTSILNAYVFQSLQTMNRLESLAELKRDLAKSDVVLSRYFMSGVVYGADDGVPSEWLEAIHNVFPQPDVHLLLDIDVTTSYERRPERRDVYEKQAGKMARIVERYRNIWNERRVTDPMRWVIIDARGTKDETAALIEAAVARAREARE